MNNSGMQELVANLERLEEQWAKDNPNRARGGRVATAGFRYQFYLYLFNLIQEWVSCSNDERCSVDKFSSAMERLSDIISISKSGMVIATQSKLTLRGSGIEDALDEFETIHASAIKICPSIVPKIKYRIICSNKEIINCDTTIKNWTLKHKITSSNAPRFIENVEVKVESFPENRILVLITNTFKCKDPLKTLHMWLGQLLDCAKSAELMDNFGKQVWNELNALWRNCTEIKDSIYIWQDMDIPPEQVSMGSVLIGQRPQVHHLRKGYFSSRTEVYNDIEKFFLSLVDSIDYNSIEKIQLFWIGGRSGSGKSVALLHLLGSLNEMGFGPIVWVGHETALLRSAVKFIIESEERCNTPIIAIDDPYAVGIDINVSQHWDEVFAYLHSYRQDGNFKVMPIFIACGPTEQAHLFKCDYNEYFDFHIRELPHETTKENKELRHWYQQRTGEQPPDIIDDNSLMVQLFFQWDRHQSISDFSIRLKERLVLGDLNKGIFSLVSKVLSLNRLYIGYPHAAVNNNLTPEQKDLLGSLENDLHLGKRENYGINGYWLLHAHLADALYLNWFETKHGSYIAYLKEAIIDSIKFGDNPNEQTAPLWAISRIFRQTTKDELCKRLNEKDAIEVLLYIFNYLQDNLAITVSMLPVWVEICALKPELVFASSPIDLAIKALNYSNIGETGLRLLCHKLLQHFTCFHYNKQQEIRNAIIELLEKTSQWNEWIPITKNAMIVLQDQRLFDLVIHVLSKDFNYNMTDLLYVSIKESPQNRELTSLCLGKLSLAPCTYYWIEIVRELVKNSKDDLHETIIRWLKSNIEDKHICFVLKDALVNYYIPVRDIAIQWANQWYWLDYAPFVLEPLIEHECNDEHITNLCYQWIMTAKGDKSYMIEKLLRNRAVTPEIISAIVTWLKEEDSKSPSWLYAWEALNNVQITSNLSFELGMIWLKENNKDHQAWPYIWNDLYKANPNYKELLDMGIQWIIQTDNEHIFWQRILNNLTDAWPSCIKLKQIKEEWYKHFDITYDVTNPTFPYNWQYLYKENPKSVELIQLGKRWLVQTDKKHISWTYVWRLLFEKNIEDLELISLGKEWLSQLNRNHIVWHPIWSSIFDQIPNDPEVFKLGLMWLNEISFNNRQWTFVWEKLFHVYVDSYDLVELAEKWLIGVDYNAARWNFIWHKINKSKCGDKPNLLEIGKSWLNVVSRKHSGWVSVWDSVYKADINNTNLFNIGLDFLNNLDSVNGTWGNIWSLLFKAKADDSYLFEIGMKHIREAKNKELPFRSIWTSLTKKDPSNNELHKIGFRWITNNEYGNPNWQYIWLNLNEIAQNEDLYEYGVQWLILRMNYNGAWSEVAIKLLDSYSDNLRVVNEAKRWLSKVDVTHGSWAGLWIRVIKYRVITNHLLYEKGYEWLKRSQLSSKYWASIWLELIDYFKEDDFLLNCGLYWLDKNLVYDPNWSEIVAILDKHTI